MQEFIAMWQNYANFGGRTSVRGYWMAFLFNVIASFVVGIVAGILSLFISPLAYLSSLYSLAALIPGLALTVRRLHDTGKSWVYILIGLIPLVGTILLIIWLCGASVPGANEFGDISEQV